MHFIFQCAKSYKSVLEKWVRPRWACHRVREFDRPAMRAAIEEWLYSLLRSPKNLDGLAPKTVRSIHNVMNLPSNSAAFAGWIGPRISEVFGLQWQDLNLDEGVVSFRRGFVQGRITPLKTEASRTNLPLPEEVLELLRQWHSITPYNQPSQWVFASPYTRGQRPFRPAQLLKTHIKPVALGAGLPGIGWHSFRHTVSAWGKEAGLELEDVKTLLRHENIATTSEVYGHLGMDAKRRIQQRPVEFVTRQAGDEASKRTPAWQLNPPVTIQ